MKIEEVMERVGSTQTGRIIAYVKDALNEINSLSETHTAIARVNIRKGQRFYRVPENAVQILDVRCKDHKNEDGLYETIPRMAYEPPTEDEDGF
tara:strand:+ start:346 stop:627 length:282 start_codon:yes stop_codon:yes gene_type:complete